MSNNTNQPMPSDLGPTVDAPATAPLVVVVDDGHSRLGPLSDLRALVDQRTGPFTQGQRLDQWAQQHIGEPVALFVVPNHLHGLTQHPVPHTGRDPKSVASHETFNDALHAALQTALQTMDLPDSETHAASSSVLLVSAAWSGVAWDALQQTPNQLPALNHAWTTETGQPLVVHVDVDTAAALDWSSPNWALPDTVTTHAQTGVDVIRFPWDILNGLAKRIEHDAATVTTTAHPADGFPPNDPGLTVIGDPTQIKILGPVTVDPGAVLDTRKGPIVLGAGAHVSALAVLEGPCAVMDQAVVQPHALIRPNTVIGPVCKVAGEISGSVFQGYSNKGHLGFVGDSLVGAWCNMGANTNVSNLKNTYGPVRIPLEKDQPTIDSGRLFHGPIFGDFVRTAIGTHVLTGSVIGTGTMLASSGYPPKHVAPFRFITDQGDQAHDLDAFFKTVDAMMGRRGLQRSQAFTDAVTALVNHG